MRTDSTPECGTDPHLTVNLAGARTSRRVRRQETGGETGEVGHFAFPTHLAPARYCEAKP